MSRDAFENAWRVREVVFAADGHPLGEVHQRRHLRQEDGGAMRVIQDCAPGPELDGHPMARFAGHHEFSLVREGAFRRYLGPAVVGSATALGEGAMVGRGLWPVFGWSFSSWSVLVAPDRQLTGGRFFRGDHSMATVVGIASPEGTTGGEAPRYGRQFAPWTLARTWVGSFVRVNGRGEPLAVGTRRRRYDGEDELHSVTLSPVTVSPVTFSPVTFSPVTVSSVTFSSGPSGPSGLRWTDEETETLEDVRDLQGSGGHAFTMVPLGGAWSVRGEGRDGGMAGFLQGYGPMMAGELVVGRKDVQEWLEVFDEEGSNLVALRKRYDDGLLVEAEVWRLKPEDGP